MRIIDALLRTTVGRRLPGAYPVYQFGRRVIDAFENRNIDIETNGERWFQKRLAQRGVNWAFDVGANRGEWARGFLDLAHAVKIVCYEPVPATFAALEKGVISDRAELVEAALSRSPGTIEIQSVVGRSELSSVHADYGAHLPVESFEVETRTCDNEMARLGIERLDVMKVDAEGHDYAVLEGAQAALSQDKIDFLQFEYNFATLAARCYLKDFFDLLGPKFLICRLLPRGLEAMAYHSSLDHFGQSNWMCVRRSLVDQELARQFNISRAKGLPGNLLAQDLKGDERLGFLAE